MGFEPQNMFSMVNTMINDPEFKKLAQNFEDQMKNSMEEMKKAHTSESQKTYRKIVFFPQNTKFVRLPKVYNSNVQSKKKQPEIVSNHCFNSIEAIHSRTGPIEHEQKRFSHRHSQP